MIVVGVKEPQPDLTEEIAKVQLVTAVTKTGSEYRIKAGRGRGGLTGDHRPDSVEGDARLEDLPHEADP